MNEKFTYLEGAEQSESSKEGLPRNSKLRHAVLTGAAIISTFLMASCDSRSSDPVKQQERIARHEQELEYVTYQLSVKIEARKPLVEEYNRLLAQCQAEPDNASLRKYTRQVEKKIIKCNKEIESLAEEKLNKTVRLDDDRSRSQNGLGTGRSLTDANYFDFLIQGQSNQINASNTINYYDVEIENQGETGNSQNNNSIGTQREETLESLVRS